MKHQKTLAAHQIFKGILAIVFIFGMAPQAVHAQLEDMTDLDLLILEADSLVAQYKFSKAATAYEEALMETRDEEIRFKLAGVYKYQNRLSKAAYQYEKAFEESKDLNPEHFYDYADILVSLERFEEAYLWYTAYLQITNDERRAASKIYSLDHRENLFKDSASYFVKSVQFNSHGSEFSPTFYDGNMYFISARGKEKSMEQMEEGEAFMDIYQATQIDADNFTKPIPFDKRINSKWHEGPLAIFNDGNEIIFTRNDPTTKGKKVNKLQLYHAKKEGDKWSEPEKLPFVTLENSYGHPACTSSGDTLVFVSDMAGGEGATDLYMTVRENDMWSKPRSLGDFINTKGNEMFPSIYKDQYLFFASNGHGGLGGLDNFVCKLDDNPVLSNLGYPINSGADDFALITLADDKSGFFSSNRGKFNGDDDIYEFTREDTEVDYMAVLEEGVEIDEEMLGVLLSAKLAPQYAAKSSGRSISWKQTMSKLQEKYPKMLSDSFVAEWEETNMTLLGNYSDEIWEDSAQVEKHIDQIKEFESPEGYETENEILAAAEEAAKANEAIVGVDENGNNILATQIGVDDDGNPIFSTTDDLAAVLKSAQIGLSEGGKRLYRVQVGTDAAGNPIFEETTDVDLVEETMRVGTDENGNPIYRRQMGRDDMGNPIYAPYKVEQDELANKAAETEEDLAYLDDRENSLDGQNANDSDLQAYEQKMRAAAAEKLKNQVGTDEDGNPIYGAIADEEKVLLAAMSGKDDEGNTLYKIQNGVDANGNPVYETTSNKAAVLASLRVGTNAVGNALYKMQLGTNEAGEPIYAAYTEEGIAAEAGMGAPVDALANAGEKSGDGNAEDANTADANPVVGVDRDGNPIYANDPKSKDYADPAFEGGNDFTSASNTGPTALENADAEGKMSDAAAKSFGDFLSRQNIKEIVRVGTSGGEEQFVFTGKIERFIGDKMGENNQAILDIKANSNSTQALATLSNSQLNKLRAAVKSNALDGVETADIESIHFEYDKSFVRDQDMTVLRKLADILKDNKSLKVVCTGHTDNRGSDQYNDKLSKRRAQSAVDFLIAAGVKRSQILMDFRGEDEPAVCKKGANCSEAQHFTNRRADFKIILESGDSQAML